MVAPEREVPGDDGQHLPHADDEGFAVGDLFQPGDMRGGAAVLHKDEEDTVQDQHSGDCNVIVGSGPQTSRPAG